MNFFLNSTAQRFGKDVSSKGAAYIESVFEKTADRQMLFAACHLLAEAAYVDTDSQYWCAPAHMWLFNSGFEPSKELLSAACNFLKAEVENESEEELLRTLTNAPYKMRKRKMPKISASALKKRLKNSEIDLEKYGSGFMVGLGESNNLQCLAEIGYLQSEIDVSFVLGSLHSNHNLEESLKMLLYGAGENIVGLLFTAESGVATDTKFDPDQILSRLTGELKFLNNLRQFCSERLFVDDSVIEAITFSKTLEGLRIEPNGETAVTKASIKHLESCMALECVIIESDGFGEKEAKTLLRAKPNLDISAGDFYHEPTA